MDGKRLKINIAAILLLMTGFLSSPECTYCAQRANGFVAILISDTQEAYTRPVDTFIDEIQMPARVFNLKGNLDNAPRQMAEILALRPALIFALGAKAAYTAKVWTADRQKIPVIFAMVLNWQRYGLLDGQNNIAGIASEVAPGTQLANMAIASPQVKKVGVIYSPSHSLEIVQQAKAAAAKLGLEILDMPVNRPKEFRQAYKKIAGKIDGYWMLADPVVYNLDNVNWLEQRCARDRIVCVGQSKNIVELGVLLAVNPDVANVGLQAASMAKSILLRHQQPKQIGVMPPLGTHLVLNIKTAEEIGLELDRAVLDMASEIIDK